MVTKPVWPEGRFGVPQITPYTYRDGHTQLELIKALRDHMVDELHPSLDQALQNLVNQMEAEYGKSADQYVNGVQEFQRIHDQFMTDINARLTALNDHAVSDLIDDDGSQLYTTLRNRFLTLSTHGQATPRISSVQELPANASTVNTMFERFLQESIDVGKRAHFTEGTYEIAGRPDPVVLIPAGKQWAITGEPGAVIRMADKSVTQNWSIPLSIGAAGGGDVERLDISGITFDGNRRGQNVPTNDDYAWQHSANIRIFGNLDDSSRIKYVSLRDLEFRDPIADCVWIGNYYIDSLVIQGMHVSERHGTRSDIQISSLPRITQITDFIGQRIEFEPGIPPADVTHDFLIQGNQIQCQQNLDLLGHSSIAHRIRVELSNVYSHETWLGYCGGVIRDSQLHFRRAHQRRIYYPHDLVFEDCDIYLHSDENGHIEPLDFYVNTPGYSTSATFRGCRFHAVAHPNYTGKTFTGAALSFQASDTSGNSSDTYRFENCWWDERFQHNLYINRTHTVELINNDYGSWGEAIIYRGQSSFNTINLRVDGGQYDRCQGGFISGLAVAATSHLELSNVVQDETTGQIVYNEGDVTNMDTTSTRTILVDDGPPVWGFVGDRARLKTPQNGQVFEWICTQSSYRVATWQPVTQVG